MTWLGKELPSRDRNGRRSPSGAGTDRGRRGSFVVHNPRVKHHASALLVLYGARTWASIGSLASGSQRPRVRPRRSRVDPASRVAMAAGLPRAMRDHREGLGRADALQRRDRSHGTQDPGGRDRLVGRSGLEVFAEEGRGRGDAECQAAR